MKISKTWQRVLVWLNLQKEGIMVGAFVGGILYLQYVYDFIGKSIFWMGVPTEPWWMSLSTIMFLSILAGAITDSIYKPRQ